MRRVALFFLVFGWIVSPAAAAPQEASLGLRLIVVRTAAEAEDLRMRVEAGSDFEQLARDHSIDPSAGRGGNLGTVQLNQLRGEFRDAVGGLAPGGLSPVVRVGAEYVLLQVLEAESVQPTSPPRDALADRPWAEAVIANDAIRIRALLDRGAQVDSRLQDGSTALVVAAYGGRADTVGILIAAGADVNATTRAGATALMAAALVNHAEVARTLIAAGADVNLRADNGATALMEAAYGGHMDTVRVLVDSGAEVGIRYDGGATVLMSAAIEGDVQMARAFVDAGADPDALLADGTTALMKAASAGHVDLVRVVIEAGADVNRRSGTGATALVEAAYAGQAEVARLLIAEGADVNASLDDGSTVLMAAAPGDHADIVGMLLAAGADVHRGPADGSTALMEAAYGGSAEVVRVLLTAGAEVNAALDSGLTALMAAALGGYAEVVGDLLDAGADPAAEDSEGWTALTHATASGSPATVDLLLASGGARDATEAALRIGTSYANEYYVSNDTNDIERARREFQRVLEHDPNHPGALEWMGALEVLQWGGDPDLEQFRRARAFLKRSVELDPDDADRHYWVASTNWTFVSQGTAASATERGSILDEGIEHAVKAIALDPWFDDAVAYLELLYRSKAEAVDTPAERNQLLDLAGATSREAVRIREERGGRLTRPDDQFSRPAPLPPPARRDP